MHTNTGDASSRMDEPQYAIANGGSDEPQYVLANSSTTAQSGRDGDYMYSEVGNNQPEYLEPTLLAHRTAGHSELDPHYETPLFDNVNVYETANGTADVEVTYDMAGPASGAADVEATYDMAAPASGTAVVEATYDMA